MSLSDLASIGSLISGIAVLISLVYVAIQIKQTERNQRTLLQAETANRAVELVRHWSDPHIAAIYVKMLRAEDLTDIEAFQLSMQFRTTLLSWQDGFLLHRASLIEPLQLESTLRTFKVMLSQPVFRALWNMTRGTFSPEFAEHVEANTRDLVLAPPHDYGEQLKAAVAEVKAAKK